METAASETWVNKASELIKCPIKTCKFSFRCMHTALKSMVEDRLYSHLYRAHNKSDLIKGILILAGLKEDIEEAS